MDEKLSNIPTNLIMGFLGVGKTTAIINLIKQKPENENWAVLVNEFGKIGIDGALFSAAGIAVKEVAGGCLCCAVSVPFRVGLNQLLKKTRPDRLLIEPTGLGHPKKVLDMLQDEAFKKVLDLRASITLVDPEKLKQIRYTNHKNFIDQIALADVLVANKMDLADTEAVKLFYQWANKSRPEKTMVAETSQGQLELAWLDISTNKQRQAFYPYAHSNTKADPMGKKQMTLIDTDSYQSFGCIFPQGSCFDYEVLSRLLNEWEVERIKGIFFTNKGWFVINKSGIGGINQIETLAIFSSRVEIIALHNHSVDISARLKCCRIDDIDSDN
jgi:G3E family GTPase